MSLKQLNILLADDDMDDCYFFKKALADLPLSTHLKVENDGERLMQLLSNEPDELPDVIFLDLNMPRKNGFECLEEIKRNEKLKKVPVIIYTSSFHTKIAALLYKNGATYYISKPPDFQQLRETVQQMVTRISKGSVTQPAEENFVLNVEKSNYQKLIWFVDLFAISYNQHLS